VVRVISGHSGSGQIGSIRVIFGSGLDRINKISGRFGFGLGHFGFRINSGQRDFGSVRFWVGSILVSDRIRFRSFGCRFGSRFGSFGSVHSVRVSFARSSRECPNKGLELRDMDSGMNLSSIRQFQLVSYWTNLV